MDLLLIDNSNIFIGVRDIVTSEGRFDYDKFVKDYTNNVNQKKILVGSTPPKSDSFWSTMSSKGFDIFTYERKISREKGVDGKILVEGIKHLERYKKPGKLILMSGDLDMRSLIEEAYSKKWEIILWGWKNSINLEYVSGDLSWCISKINYLDEVAENLIYFNHDEEGYFKKEYLRERLIRLDKEKKEKEFKQFQDASNQKVKNLFYLDEDIQQNFVNQINKSTTQASINEILETATIEDNKLKEKIQKEELERIQIEKEKKKQEEYAKEQAAEEFWINNWHIIVSGVATVAGGIWFAIKKSKK
ncbi:hypothetical protein AT575_00290 [Streptococcus penaeicida]|uniref:NYN domain-containing protein n=1 Tax=Streptococcus penaeicida TaxID=1765960 RepID=A0A2N8LEJ9_9STRE|nr:NYN domain-containing protein [Streptococcus penaeicida]PND48588.1 hypothetical protein AT575_00290 [Streptococcus penaeicida]